jgi:hypothetical protein
MQRSPSKPDAPKAVPGGALRPRAADREETDVKSLVDVWLSEQPQPQQAARAAEGSLLDDLVKRRALRNMQQNRVRG